MSSNSRFTVAPTLRFNRTKYKMNHVHKTTMNVGDLVPVYLAEGLPGDTERLRAKFVSRLTSSFIKVPLDNLYMDINFFWVPNRIIWSKWVNLMGENTDGYWANSQVYEVPTLRFDRSTVVAASYRQSLGDYLGIPYFSTPTDQNVYSQLPFRAFAKIWNDWYRNENTQAPVLIDSDAYEGIFEVSGVDDWAPNSIFGRPPKVSKFHDYFTSCLPAPQKGAPVALSVVDNGDIPVVAGEDHRFYGSNPMRMRNLAGQILNTAQPLSINPTSPAGQTAGVVRSNGSISGSVVDSLVPSNLYARAAGFNDITVNDIRYAFAIQRILEADARYGTRYTEYLQGQFGVSNPDLRLQRSEYLGGSRTPIEFQAVAQTSQGTEDSPQANLSAYSHSGGQAGFVKSFGEDGFVLGIACIRQKHTYSQGVNRLWLRKQRFDFYNPALARIGEQPVRAVELFADAYSGRIFGYQEAWAEYRFQPDRVSGFMRPDVIDSLAVWNFADNYEGVPSLNQSFLNETSEYVDRTLSVPSELAPNFLVDFAFEREVTRVMPANSIPSLVDHVGGE